VTLPALIVSPSDSYLNVNAVTVSVRLEDSREGFGDRLTPRRVGNYFPERGEHWRVVVYGTPVPEFLNVQHVPFASIVM
jgi:hypothetical protein